MRATLAVLVIASMLASEDGKRSPVDQWNKVGTPGLDELAPPSPFSALPIENPWTPIGEKANKTWASLSGLMLQGAPYHQIDIPLSSWTLLTLKSPTPTSLKRQN